MEAVVSSTTPTTNGISSTPTVAVDPNFILEHFAKLIEANLEATRDQLEEIGSLLSQTASPGEQRPPKEDTIQRCTRLAAESSPAVLYVQKESIQAENAANVAAENGDQQLVEKGSLHQQHRYTLSETFSPTPRTTAVLVVSKPTSRPIDPAYPLMSQIICTVLPVSSLFEASSTGTDTQYAGILYNLMHSAIAPFFNEYSKGQKPGGKRIEVDSKSGISSARQKIADAELALRHLQQSAGIPVPTFSLHQYIEAQVAEGKSVEACIESISPDLLEDSTFLNQLSKTVANWTAQAQETAAITRDPKTGTASEEIKFWIEKEEALKQVEEMMKSPGVRLTIEILHRANRRQATASFYADNNMKEPMDICQKYNQLLRDFPLDELLSASSLDMLQGAVKSIFGHISKKLRMSSYPIARLLPFVEAISADLDMVLQQLLAGRILMQLPYEDFRVLLKDASGVFQAWDDNIKEFTNVAREVTRRRSEKFIPIKINARHTQLRERLKYVETFRNNHEQLQRTIVSVLGSKDDTPFAESDGGNDVVIIEEIGGVDAVKEVREAFESLRDVNVLDLTPDGTSKWARAEAAYNERTARIENSIIERLRERLAGANSANEMFRVFSKFNPLFVRPKIRSAVAEYQTRLIDEVERDINALHDRYKQQYGRTEAYRVAQLRDLPPMAGAIIWAKGIERQLDGYMKKVADVLGDEWTLHAEGARLQVESDQFRSKLDTKPIVDLWLADAQKKRYAVEGPLFNINKNRAAANALELAVNFNPQIIALFKETRNLHYNGFSVPNSITTISKEARKVYPFAVNLMESSRTLTQTISQISQMPDVSSLLNGYLNDVYAHIAKGIPLKWESFVHIYNLHQVRKPAVLANGSVDVTRGESRHVQFIREFSNSVSLLQTKTDTLKTINVTVQKALAELEVCPYDGAVFREKLESIQVAVDQLNLQNYVNLGHWVHGINSRLEEILLRRLKSAISGWIEAFHDTQTDAESRPRTADSTVGTKLAVLPIQPSKHEVTMRNQVIFLDPPLEYARAKFIAELHNWLGIVCNLERIRASRYQLTLASAQEEGDRFNVLPRYCTDSLYNVYSAIEEKLSEIGFYVDEWLQFQSLWDLQSEQVYEQLGDNLSKWLQILQEIRTKRSLFDNPDEYKSFGHVTVEYGQVQTKVNAKYDQWQHEVQNKFAGRLGIRIREIHAELERARQNLEVQSLEASSTQEAVQFITIVQDCQRKVKAWGPDIETFSQGHITLVRQRHQFPADWLPIEQVTSEWDALNELLARKAKIVSDQTEALQAKITLQDQLVSKKIEEIIEQWNEEKPVSGTIPPQTASATLSSFESRISKLHEESVMIAHAKEALDLPATSSNVLPAILEELQDFKSVWAALDTIWKSLNELREGLWSSVQPRKLRGSLDDLIKMTKEMPSRMRQYAAFEHIQNVLRGYLKVNDLVKALKSEAMRDRHWNKIYKALKPGKRYSPISMTLGDVWDLNLPASKVVIEEVLAQASGELSLEEFLREVRETWTNYSLDLVGYQNKCRLIRGWDDLFAKCSENLNSLQAARHSAHYKQFEEEASSWEDKLNRVHALFDVWIDVQRQWVYLEGVFTGNADIKHLLPVESNRFQNINTEFLAVLKKVYKSPFVLDVLNIPEVQKSLERLADLLNKIQKALGEYLEKERVSFPRFYFVGDEDLLEMIGNSNDTLRIAKHFKKMFAGLSGLIMDEDGVISGFTSKEGEEVRLKKEISLVKTPKINDWLALLENNMKSTLAELLSEAHEEFTSVFGSEDLNEAMMSAYIAKYPAQIVVLATQTVWTTAVEKALEAGGAGLQGLYDREVTILRLLASIVLGDLEPIQRKKCEHLITECVHQRDVIEKLTKLGASTPIHYMWLLQMRYEYTPGDGDHMQRLAIKMANANLSYGFEYLGVAERLVRTPLTDRCFLTLTQGLCQRLGGSPYGPAGTGKTESVKALGVQLGRFTLVFCCDDTFDFQAMGRIFLGICQVGAWGCFDEFNRLEERILSAVSQQIQNIQLGLKQGAENEQRSEIELAGRQLKVNGNTGIFITMNPGYAGRSNLPDNLKKLFRSVAMSKPDKELIAEVMLYSQGFNQAKQLAKQTVPFFDRCGSRLSKQAHYDFGLRALKSVLVSSGGLKRARLTESNGDLGPEEEIEPQIIVQSIRETIAPKLIKDDVEIMRAIEVESFPGVEYVPASLQELRAAIKAIAIEQNLVVNDTWMTKILQLYQIQTIHHGVMMVGNSGSGKSAAWKILLEAMQRVEKVEGVHHVIDSKVMPKEALYGNLDSTTREWTDGLFTSILRKIVDNLRGEDSKRHWIVFDGDVDPEWVENLNSVLDDNKLLTLPNGERLSLPPNVRIMFEVENLKYATLATVSRCGMVWFSEDTVTPDMMVENYLGKLKSVALEDLDEDSVASSQATAKTLSTQNDVSVLLQQLLKEDDFLNKALERALGFNHIMEFTVARVLNTLFSLLNKAVRDIVDYNSQHTDFPLEAEQLESYISKKLLLASVWSFTGDCPLPDRKAFGDYLAANSTSGAPLLDGNSSLIDYNVSLPQAQWTSWQNQVPTIEVNTHSITQTDVVIPTLDTVRHEDILYSWLAEHKPLLLCGPPGSGKTMTLFSALRKLPNIQDVGVNFSSATTPDLLIKTLEQYCEYKKTVNGVRLSPTQMGRWLVVFCDEINLPAPDKYGTQRAISFLRQLVEQNGFWRTSDKTWVTLDRIQFVGACNPPTDAGRTPMGARFLRHAPLVMVDYPAPMSLQQIYGTFTSAVLKVIPALRGYAEALTSAMVQLYSESQARFTPKIQPHYVYSPRELTRWVRGIYEAIVPLETLSLEGLIRIWAHEALRLFQDRLVAVDERRWTDDAVKRIALEHFPTIDEQMALGGPILYSNWLSKNYVPVDRGQLREHVKARLKTFCEEEVDVPLILFNDVLEHVLRIDRVFRQTQGHLILIGVSGSGKTTLSRFVAWMNGLKVFQIKVHGKYSAEDFDNDLRDVLRRSGCKDEKICFIMDESNVLDSGFLERMNTLLANGEVPGLFEGDEHAALMTACKEGAQRQGLLLDSHEELYSWFTKQIVKNLHVVFTMNPPEDGLSSKAATSPALFNRCVLNWFGDWSDQALFQVGSELTQSVDLDRPNFTAPDSIPVAYSELVLPANHRQAVINSMVWIHQSMERFNTKLFKQQGRVTYLTPRHFLDFVHQYVKLYNEKREDLEDQQRHLNVGLEKLRDTFEKVRDMRTTLAQKTKELEVKEAEANEKLQVMVANQNAAQQQKAVSVEIQAKLDMEKIEVAENQESVQRDLAKAEPAVMEAKKSVNNIKKQHLNELRSMANPPTAVKLALSAVCTLLGSGAKIDDWKMIQGIIRKDDFIPNIIKYDNEKQMTARVRAQMRNEFLDKPEFTYDNVYRASRACGPLVEWVEAQVVYSEVLEKVGPLRAKVEMLANQAMDTEAQAQALENKIAKLEQSIAEYKQQYARLIAEVQNIKSEMDGVQFKVDRSVRLLDSLSSESTRWEESSKLFETQMNTLVGDVLVAAAFLAYSGLFDQQFRKNMLEDWLDQLHNSGIVYKQHNYITEYLSTADERLGWQENSLPVDDLCTENAIILKRFNRYPLIIDPSGRTTEFLKKECNNKLAVTSFLDDSFIKQLESSLRFGSPILIQDAEHLDPILNSVLNKEYQKTGGRVLIQLGKQEIDIAPQFKIYLSTRDPSATFAPDICSRTTLVNFTVTQSSLQTQSLNEVLKSERPDVEERRSNLIKLQGEFKVHLRQLEKRLLQALNESRGNILDDDRVIETLETLKKEAADISDKMSNTEGVMAEVDEITLQYAVIAQSCSAVFAVLEQLHYLNHFYQFSLQYFLDIFHTVLHNNPRLEAGMDHNARRTIIIEDLFITTYQRTSLGLLQKDRISLAMLLAQASPFKMDKSLIDVILDESNSGVDLSTDSGRQEEVFAKAMRLPVLRGKLESVPQAAWDKFLTEENAENVIPQIGDETTPKLDRDLLSLLLIKLFRMDRFVPAAERFVASVFSPKLFEMSEDLKQTVEQVPASRPIALCSSPGFDASYKVDNLVSQTRASCTNIAMGSNESLSAADKAINNAASSGSWVLVKNVHLAPQWLQSLEKRMESLRPHADFRLFLSMESSPKIPVNLLRACRVLMYEQPAGIRANMKDSLSSVHERAIKTPVERTRLYLLLSFLHAVVQERLRYAPNLGWKGFWEFNDSDYECSAFVIDTWVNTTSDGRSNIAPQNLPWDMLRTLITETYGGKIDDEGDFALLTSLVQRIMTPTAYEIGHKLVESTAEDGEEGALVVPAGTGYKEYMAWVNKLPEREPPTYLGLPSNAEKLVLVEMGRELCGNVGRIVGALDEGERVMAEAAEAA